MAVLRRRGSTTFGQSWSGVAGTASPGVKAGSGICGCACAVAVSTATSASAAAAFIIARYSYTIAARRAVRRRREIAAMINVFTTVALGKRRPAGGLTFIKPG